MSARRPATGHRIRAESWTVHPGAALSTSTAALLLALPPAASAQQALRDSIAGEQAVAARKATMENQPYTYKAGDFRLLTSASLGAEYNDDVTLSNGAPEDDFILKPLLDLSASYPITSWNLLKLQLGVGYDCYLQHSDLDALRLNSGSELSFDVYVKDIWINLHDRFSYSQNSGTEAAVALSGRYGGLDNTPGLTTTWDLQDLVLTLGYDHENFLSSASEFEYLDRASELLLARAGFRVHPKLTTGLEATGSFTSYDQPVLNDSTSYSAGLFADWQPGPYFRVQPRAGYTFYLFDQTSRVIRAVDQDAWYADLTVTHAITETISYSISAGHELRLGIQADSIEDTYIRPAVHWAAMKRLNVTASFSYENGTQGNSGSAGGLHETYDWFSAGLGLSHHLTDKLMVSLDYRYTYRTSDAASRDYTQNLVTLRATYSFQ